MRSTIRHLRGVALTAVRRGQPTVIWAPGEGLGFGNFLYLWLHAHGQATKGRKTLVLVPPRMQYWLDAFPKLQELSIRRSDVPFFNARTWGWFSDYGTDFDRELLQQFIQERLVSPTLVTLAQANIQTLTVNVRRGNYYSEPHFRGTYSFDIGAYLAEAMNALPSSVAIDRVRVVSDGVDWCRLKLHDQLAAWPQVEYCEPTDTPLKNFVDCAASAALVGTNSSFSYWAGYTSNVLHGSDSVVVMPRFHARLGSFHDAYQLDPGWRIIDDIPGGWDS